MDRFGPYFVEPIVAGLKADNKPFISGFDLIGAPVFTEDFVVGGTCTENLHGMCESLYRPDMVRGGWDKEKMWYCGAACLPGSCSLISYRFRSLVAACASRTGAFGRLENEQHTAVDGVKPTQSSGIFREFGRIEV